MLKSNINGFGNDQHTKIKINNEETVASATFTESSFAGNGGSGHTVTILDNAPNRNMLVPGRFTYGRKFSTDYGSYAYFRVSNAIHADWTFASVPYTMDLWFSVDSSFADPAAIWYCSIAGLYVDANNNNHIQLYRTAGGTESIRYYINEAGVNKITITYDFSFIDTGFHHLSIVRLGSSFSMYIDGYYAGTDTYASALANLSTPFKVGNMGVNGVVNAADAITIDEFRLSTGIARWINKTSLGLPAYTEPNRAY